MSDPLKGKAVFFWLLKTLDVVELYRENAGIKVPSYTASELTKHQLKMAGADLQYWEMLARSREGWELFEADGEINLILPEEQAGDVDRRLWKRMDAPDG